MHKMIIAEDNQQLANVLAAFAKKEAFAVSIATDGEEALSLFKEQGADILLLDIMMPKKDGFAVCRAIRQSSNVPIIMITARGEDFERIMGLDMGADDYIVKPFSPAEVMARVRAVLRRGNCGDKNQAQNDVVLSYFNLIIDTQKYSALLNDVPLSLTRKEFELLWHFIAHPGRVFSRDELLDEIWGYDYFGDARTVDSHIKRLRAKLAAADKHYGKLIATVWGIGYKCEDKDTFHAEK